MSIPRSPLWTRAETAALFDAVRAGSLEWLGVLDRQPLLFVDLGSSPGSPLTGLPELFGSVVVGVGSGLESSADLDGLDLLLTTGDSACSVQVDDLELAMTELSTAISASPIAAVTLTQILRSGEHRSIADGLLYESLAYSTLQSSDVFQSWLKTRPAPKPETENGPLVLSERTGERVTLTLNRPERRNALGSRLRDALCDAIDVAVSDPHLNSLVLKGSGPDFSAGGDLNEFGTATDGGLAHQVRVTRSPGARLAALRTIVTAEVHGACIGAGIELPAFAGHLRAQEGTRFRLPELAMGLIPGAGGTVSIPRRIGRHRAAWMALTGSELDVATALRWGLIDELTTTRS